MKLKHNKKRNTAFLFEILVRELTLASIKENKDHKKNNNNAIEKYTNKLLCNALILLFREF